MNIVRVTSPSLLYGLDQLALDIVPLRDANHFRIYFADCYLALFCSHHRHELVDYFALPLGIGKQRIHVLEHHGFPRLGQVL
jgi:hypothetical protein